jgi:hypothetical protein
LPLVKSAATSIVPDFVSPVEASVEVFVASQVALVSDPTEAQ